MTPAEVLQAFYNAYAKWLGMGAPGHTQVDGFEPMRSRGLCGNLSIFGLQPRVDYAGRVGAETLMKQQFKDAGLDPNHPFESSTMYWLRVVDGSVPECPNRIKWVQEHAQGITP